MRHALFKIAAVCLAIGSAWLWMGGNAEADDFGGGLGPGFVADSADHWFCFDPSVTAVDRPYHRDAMHYMDSAVANLYDVESSSCGSATDVVWVWPGTIMGDPTIRGMAHCAVWVNAFRCDQNWTQINAVPIFTAAVAGGGDVGASFYTNLHKTIRHELGHTLGLRHSNGGNWTAGWTRNTYRAMASGHVTTTLHWLVWEPTDHLVHLSGFY